MSVGAITFLSVFIFVIVVLFMESFTDIKNQTFSNSDDSDCMSFDRRQQVLTLKSRTHSSRKLLKIVPDFDLQTKYKPKSIVYTGATVGGITTGGFHEEGGYNYISGKTRTGKFNLYYGDATLPIKRILLTDELYEQAKASKISEYLSRNSKELIVVQDIPFSYVDQLGIKIATEQGDKDLATKMALDVMRKGFPSLEKCQQIVSWICGELI